MKSKTERKELDFDVGLQPIFTKIAGVERALTRQVTWNKREDKELFGYVSDKYHIITHKQVFEALDRVLKEKGLVVKDELVLASKSKGRMEMFITLTGAEMTIEEPKYGLKEEWDIGFSIGNTIDGVGSLKASSYMVRNITGAGLQPSKILGKEFKTHSYSNLEGWLNTTLDGIMTGLDRRFGLLKEAVEVDVQLDEFLAMTEDRLGVRFRKSVERQLEEKPAANPLYRVTRTDLSLYDALSLLMYVNKLKQNKVSLGSISLHYGKIEDIIKEFLK